MDETEMKTKKGKRKFDYTIISRKYIGISWRDIFMICLPILFAGCVHWPDIAYDCEAYGVREDHQPMGSMVHIEPLQRDQLEVYCAGAELVALVNPDRGEVKINGCAIPYPDGLVRAYYWVGDNCARNHELCHATQGPRHTALYERDLRNGVSRPYCPSNQLVQNEIWGQSKVPE